MFLPKFIYLFYRVHLLKYDLYIQITAIHILITITNIAIAEMTYIASRIILNNIPISNIIIQIIGITTKIVIKLLFRLFIEISSFLK